MHDARRPASRGPETDGNSSINKNRMTTITTIKSRRVIRCLPRGASTSGDDSSCAIIGPFDARGGSHSTSGNACHYSTATVGNETGGLRANSRRADEGKDHRRRGWRKRETANERELTRISVLSRAFASFRGSLRPYSLQLSSASCRSTSHFVPFPHSDFSLRLSRIGATCLRKSSNFSCGTVVTNFTDSVLPCTAVKYTVCLPLLSV